MLPRSAIVHTLAKPDRLVENLAELNFACFGIAKYAGFNVIDILEETDLRGNAVLKQFIKDKCIEDCGVNFPSTLFLPSSAMETTWLRRFVLNNVVGIVVADEARKCILMDDEEGNYRRVNLHFFDVRSRMQHAFKAFNTISDEYKQFVYWFMCDILDADEQPLTHAEVARILREEKVWPENHIKFSEFLSDRQGRMSLGDEQEFMNSWLRFRSYSGRKIYTTPDGTTEFDETSVRKLLDAIGMTKDWKDRNDAYGRKARAKSVNTVKHIAGCRENSRRYPSS